MNKKIKALIIVAVMILFFGAVALVNSYKTPEVTYQAKADEKKDDALEAIYSEADFKKMVELKARKIKAEREMEAENVRHEESVAAIEAELERIRGEELESFQ